MSFVADQVSRLDALLDQLELSNGILPPLSPNVEAEDEEIQPNEPNTNHLRELRGLVRRFSIASSGHISPWKLQKSLQDTVENFEKQPGVLHVIENELRWFAISKAAIQVYGLVLDTTLAQILSLNNEIDYWDEVLGSSYSTSLYMLQVSPLKFLNFSKTIYRDTQRRGQQVVASEEVQLRGSIPSRWRKYYGLVKDSIRDRSSSNLQSKLTSPFTQARVEARIKQKNLERLRDMNACALGILMDDGFDFPVDEFGLADHGDLQQIVSRSIVLMKIAFRLLPSSEERSTKDFEDQVYSHIDDFVEHVGADWNQPHTLAQNLRDQLSIQIPHYQASMEFQISTNGKPSGITRYWLPTTVLLLSSATLLRVFLNRKAEIFQWVRNLGTTASDFLYDWVVEPIKNIIRTIRHDSASQIALISKDSLRADRESLERMVIDFAVDSASSSLSATEIEAIRLKVQEGDLTQVWKAYEKDLRRPIIGTIRGDLIRALLILIQKTKVDVDIAIGGIDSLLKSQQLVFGFVSLTPGILVVVGATRWFMSSLGHDPSRTRDCEQMRRCIRSIHRILTKAHRNGDTSAMSYKDCGLLFTEVHVLRKLGQSVLPEATRGDFLQDLNDLADVRSGVPNQMKVVRRIYLSYGRYFN